MTVIIDTHTLFWLITGDKKLSQRARTSCRQSDTLIIPVIVVLELFYLLKKFKMVMTFYDIFEKLKIDNKYAIVSIDLIILEVSIDFVDKLEMHDAAIVATAKIFDAPIVTKDKQIKDVYLKTIW